MIVGHIGGGSEDVAYNIAKSLRCGGASHLYRNFGTPTNNTVWAYSIWFKKSVTGIEQAILGLNAATETSIKFNTSSQIVFAQGGSILATSSKVFRDPTHHMHVHIRSTGTVVEAYVNNELVLSYTGTMANLNANGIQHVVAGLAISSVFGTRAHGYISETNFVDGQAPMPSSFGQSISGGWQPKQYSGTYGNNGFRLNFSDGTSLTTLGADSSGNGNNWTLTGFSLTAGVTYDWMDDTPTNNYATANILKRHTSNATLSAADLQLAGTNGLSTVTRDCTHRAEGKIYFEVTVAALTGFATGFAGMVSIGPEGVTLGSGDLYGSGSVNGVQVVPAAAATSNWGWRLNGGTFTTTNLSGLALNDVLMIAYDPVGGKLWMGRNGTWANSGNPSTDTTPTVTGISSTYKVVGMHAYTDATRSFQSAFNFGQRPFTYTKPTGFDTLCADNITNTTISTSGSFTGDANTDGPFVFTNGEPLAMTINGNAVTFGTHADKTAGGFKVRSSSASYNAAGSNTYSITSTGRAFKSARAQANP